MRQDLGAPLAVAHDPMHVSMCPVMAWAGGCLQCQESEEKTKYCIATGFKEVLECAPKSAKKEGQDVSD